MKHYTIRLSLFVLCAATSMTIAMESERTLGFPVCLKNLSVGIANNTYDIYVQVVSSLKASQPCYREKFVSYGGLEEMGVLANIEDIKIRGTSSMSGWTYNKKFLDIIKRDAIDGKNMSGGSLLFIVSASLTGFYFSYYNWRPNDLGRLGLKRISNSGEYILSTSCIDESHPSDDFKLV